MTVQDRHKLGERITERTLPPFKYRLKDHLDKPLDFGEYEMFYDHAIAMMHLGELEDILFDDNGKRRDVAFVKHGHWDFVGARQEKDESGRMIMHIYDGFECSCCGNVYATDYSMCPEDIDTMFDWCPFCGARMNEE